MKFLLIKPGNWKNIDKLFINAPSTQPSLGLLYLGAVLEKDGHNVEILDYYMENVSREKLGKSLMSSDAVGMTILTDDCIPAMNISRVIKEIDPHIPLIIGGPHCIFFQKKSLSDFPCADISIVGEGERTILDIVNFLQGKKKLADIHGIYYRNNGSIRKGKPIKLVENLDEIPFPSRHLVEKYEYGDFLFGYQFKKKVTALITSRGCPFSCHFCARYSNFMKELNFRKRSAENVVKEIQELDEKYRSVLIVDDCFLADNKRAHKIFDMLLESNTNLEFSIRGTRVDSADRELYKKMKKAGVVFISYGIESGNQDVLDFYNKEITLKQIQEAVNLSRKMNFFTIGNFIFGAPIETKEHIENTINFACALQLDMVSITPLGFVMGSQLWEEAVENGKISKETFLISADLHSGLGNFSREELFAYINQTYKTFYFRPTYLLSQIYRSLLRKDYNLLYHGLKFILMLKK